MSMSSRFEARSGTSDERGVTMDIVLRPIEAADQPVLWEMLYLAIFVPPGARPVPREVLDTPEVRVYAEAWGRPGDLGSIAVAGDRVVGAAWLRLLNGERRGYGYVDDLTPELSIAVLPPYRGRGVGSKLIERIVSYSVGLHPAISLSVSERNPACRLYRRFGFTTVRRDGDTLTMVSRLPISDRGAPRR